MAKRSLDRIRIEGYKSIRSVDVPLTSISVLIGPNGAGKSNFVGAFGLLGSMMRGRLQVAVAEAGGARPLFYRDPSVTPEIKLQVDFGANQYEAGLGYSPTDDVYFTNETCYFQSARYSEPYGESFGGGHRESGLVQGPRSHVKSYCYEIISDWTTFHFHDTSRTSPVKAKQPVGDNSSLRQNASNLAPFLFLLRETHPDNYARIVAAIRLVAPFFDDFRLSPDRMNPEVIQLEWTQVASEAYFNGQALSDGTLRFMCLATLLLQPDPPSVIVIDEPELGLHPAAITQLADLFRSAAADGHQVIASTQSVTLLNNMELSDIVIVEQHDGESTFERPHLDRLEAWLEDYAVGELWEKNLLGGRPA